MPACMNTFQMVLLLLWGVVALVSANERKLVIALTKCPPLRDTALLNQELGYIPGDTCE